MKYTAQNLVTQILADSQDKQECFKQVISSKVNSALEAKKAAIATELYSDKNK